MRPNGPPSLRGRYLEKNDSLCYGPRIGRVRGRAWRGVYGGDRRGAREFSWCDGAPAGRFARTARGARSGNRTRPGWRTHSGWVSKLPAVSRTSTDASDSPKNLESAWNGRSAFAAYGAELERLRAARPLEQLARDLMKVAEESAHTSLELWQSWLGMRPSRWTPEKRKLLSEYVSLLQMIVGGDGYGEGAGRRVFRRYYSLFPKVAKILPCWAVTSLSARGRLPFEGGFFDLVVIDEASQCDIASALPLLYRARRAVIIGDPLQLKHVSTVAPQQDRLMLAAHGLAEGHAAWAYSVNSLFDLARSWCRYEDIVNLRDHHRSHRDIISFSNRHFYRGALRIATDHEGLKRPPAEDEKLGPAVRWIHIQAK